MKKSPQQNKLEALLRSSKLSACGFLGDDKRSLWEIIDADASELERLGRTKEDVAARMQEITNQAVSALGDWVHINEVFKVCVDDNRGMIPCPWPHAVRCLKRITTIHHLKTGKTVRWSDLNIHLIKEHGFFEGKGAPFRIDPKQLVDIIFAR
jgi:hypothetical protein